MVYKNCWDTYTNFDDLDQKAINGKQFAYFVSNVQDFVF